MYYTLFVMLLSFLPFYSIAQLVEEQSSNPTDLIAFRITNSAFHGIAQDYIAIEKHLESAIYPCGEHSKEWCFANRMRKAGTSSFGKLSNFVVENTPATDSTFGEILLFSNWDFVNDFDENSGSANLYLRLIFMEAMIKSVIYISWNQGEIAYRGYAINTDSDLATFFEQLGTRLDQEADISSLQDNAKLQP